MPLVSGKPHTRGMWGNSGAFEQVCTPFATVCGAFDNIRCNYQRPGTICGASAGIHL